MPDIDNYYFYIWAYHELETCRSSVSLGPIPFTAIAEFAKIYEVEDFEDFLYLIRVMDNTFLMLQGKKDGPSKSN